MIRDYRQIWQPLCPINIAIGNTVRLVSCVDDCKTHHAAGEGKVALAKWKQDKDNANEEVGKQLGGKSTIALLFLCAKRLNFDFVES